MLRVDVLLPKRGVVFQPSCATLQSFMEQEIIATIVKKDNREIRQIIDEYLHCILLYSSQEYRV